MEKNVNNAVSSQKITDGVSNFHILDAEIQRCDLTWGKGSSSLPFTPVEGIDIHPIIFIKDKKGRTFDDDEHTNEENPISRTVGIRYKWYRGPARNVCCYHPYRPATMQCTQTQRCFCSSECFQAAFQSVREFFTNRTLIPTPPSSQAIGSVQARPYLLGRDQSAAQGTDLSDEGAALRCRKEEWECLFDETHYLKQKEANEATGPLILPTADEDVSDVPGWTLAGMDREYVPTSDDVGRAILFEAEIYAIDAMGNEVVVPCDEICLSGEGDEHNHLVGSASTDSSAPPLKVIPPPAESAPTPHLPPSSPPSPAPLTATGAPSTSASFLSVGQSGGSLLHPSTSATHLAPPSIASNPNVLSFGTTRQGFVRVRVRTGCCIPKRSHDVQMRQLVRLTPPPAARISVPTNAPPQVPSTVHTLPMPGQGQVRVVSWNVLADIYATSEAFPYCEPYALSWGYRSRLILEDIIAQNADVICLQEVQAEHYDEFFVPALQRMGYTGAYKSKTSEIFTPGVGKKRSGKMTIDGCATFYRTSLFAAVQQLPVEFFKASKDLMPSFFPSETAGNAQEIRRLLKDNVALIVVLQETAQPPVGMAPRQLVVVNTHIAANPEHNDVKLWQSLVLLNAIDKVVAERKKIFNYSLPAHAASPLGVVVVGDFNSPPQSAVYHLLAAASVPAHHPDVKVLNQKKLSSGLRDLLASGNPVHKLNLASAYSAASSMLNQKDKDPGHIATLGAVALAAVSNLVGSGWSSGDNPSEALLDASRSAAGEPSFTNFTSTFVGCLDYIWFSRGPLSVVAVLEPVSEPMLRTEQQLGYALQNLALPSPCRPSDHVMLCVDFQWSNPHMQGQSGQQNSVMIQGQGMTSVSGVNNSNMMSPMSASQMMSPGLVGQPGSFNQSVMHRQQPPGVPPGASPAPSVTPAQPAFPRLPQQPMPSNMQGGMQSQPASQQSQSGNFVRQMDNQQLLGMSTPTQQQSGLNQSQSSTPSLASSVAGSRFPSAPPPASLPRAPPPSGNPPPSLAGHYPPQVPQPANPPPGQQRITGHAGGMLPLPTTSSLPTRPPPLMTGGPLGQKGQLQQQQGGSIPQGGQQPVSQMPPQQAGTMLPPGQQRSPNGWN